MVGVLIEHEGVCNRLMEIGFSEASLTEYFKVNPPNALGFLANKDYFQLLEYGANELNEAHVGLKIATGLTYSDLGLLGYIARNSASVGEFCNTVERYQSVLMTGITLDFLTSAGVCEARYQVLHPFNDGIRQDVELTIAVISICLEKELGENFHPIQINFSHSIVGEIETYTDIFNTKVCFDQPYNGVVFDESWLQFQLTDSDAQLRKLLQKQGDKILAEIEDNKDFVKQVRLLITTCITDESYSVERLCKQLHITDRTLRRRLKAHNLTYNSLREEILINLAKEALIKTNASVTEIALRFNYSESSAFVRAFKRVCGVSPLKFRKQHSML